MTVAIKKFHGRRVFITGAASGIGFETALAFAREGADIIATDLSEAGLTQLAEEVGKLGRSCRCERLDVSDSGAYAALAERLADDGQSPDIVVSNAGIGYFAPFTGTDEQMWRHTFDVNLFGVVNGCRLFLPAMLASGRPAMLVNVASAASYAPLTNLSAYGASKFAVEGLCDVLANELHGSKVGVLCVHPGVINTAIVSNDAMARNFRPEQLAFIQEHYRSKGVHPSVVARAIVRGVRQGKAAVRPGPQAAQGALMKRLLPKKAFLAALRFSARQMGYLWPADQA